MHIVYLTSEYPDFNSSHGGVGTFVRWISLALVERSFNVSVIGIYNKDKVEVTSKNNINFYLLPKSKWPSLKFLDHSYRLNKTLKEIEKKRKIDIIEGSELNFAFLKPIRGVKNIIRLHGGHHFFSFYEGNELSHWKSYQEKKSFKKADNFIAVSDYVGRRTRDLIHIDFEYKVIYNSFDLEYSVVNPAKRHDIILFVGSIVKKKGVFDLLEAFKESIAISSGLKLIFVGRDIYNADFPEGHIIELKKIALALGIESNIEFLGLKRHDEVLKLYSQAKIISLPSHMEAMPLAWLEALNSGTPFIASDIGPGLECTNNGDVAFLAKTRNIESLSEKINFVVSNYSQSLKKANKAQFLIRDMFDPEKLIEKNIDFYKNCMI